MKSSNGCHGMKLRNIFELYCDPSISNITLLLPLVNLYLLVFATTDNANLSIPLDAKDLDTITGNAALAALAVHDEHALANTLTGVVASTSQIPDAAGTVVAAGDELVAGIGIPRQRDNGVGVASER